MDKPLPVLLSGRTVARLLDCSRSAVRLMASEGRLPAIRISKRCVRYPIDAVQELAGPHVDLRAELAKMDAED